MTKHTHFIVWAYDRIEEGTGNYINNVIIDLIDITSEEAIKRAKEIVKGKKGYCIRSVIEHFDGMCKT